MTTQERIKLALDIHNRIQNIKAIDAELTKYNLPVLQKSAALGAHKEERIKLAALLQQRSLEKQAIMGLLGGAAKMVGKGLMGGARAGVGLGKGLAGKAPGNVIGGAGGRTLRQAAPMSQRVGHLLGTGVRRGAQALGGAAGGVGRAIRSNPMAAATGLGGIGLGAAGMAAANPAMQAINSGVNQARGMYDQGMAMAGGFGQGAQQGLESMGRGLAGAGNQLLKGFTGQLGQQMPQRGMPSYGTPGIAPPQQNNPLAMGAR